ncbi:integrase [Afipia massiliensis]|uniref:Integrase n=1 Tax=Afipia massiliensis TaxID=211460 RepID=A0A840MWF6_9BRAD|nr:tyrosine-type recombinase/integrase [Afipia massiliensis]MBB5051080.1 integrase [Afipia massiliensis]
MKWKLPPQVHGYTNRHDNPVFYLRRPGMPKIRLYGFPGSPEFMAAYEAAKAGHWDKPEIGASKTIAGTVNAALVSYYQSTAFTVGLAKSSQRMRRAILERFRQEHGDKRIALMGKTHLQIILNKKSPAASRNWKKALRGLIDHCLSLNMVTVDPLAGIKLTKMKSDGHHTWSGEEVLQFEARHPVGSTARLALVLLLQTGHARADVVRMGRQHVRGGVLSMRRQKTGVQFDIPVLPVLKAEIDHLPKSEQLAFLTTEKGKPFSAAGFGNKFREWCDEANLHHCSAHGLRKAAAARHALNGATAPELMAWFGWKSIGEAQRYIEEANRVRLAQSAGAKIIAGTSVGSPADPVSQNNAQPIENTGGGK